MPNRLDAEGRGMGIGRDAKNSQMATGDRNHITDDGRSNNMSVQFAPTDATLRQSGVYTLTEVLAQVNQKLDEHTRQLLQIWQKLVVVEQELDTLKAQESRKQTEEDRRRSQTWLLFFRFLTVLALIVIIAMLAWMITHFGAGAI